MYTRVVRNVARKRRHLRIRGRVVGTEVRPRLNVFRSNSYIYAQVIDDSTGHTLVQASSLEAAVKVHGGGLTVDKARQVGHLVAERALAQGIRQVVFDRGGYRYHGRVAALADGAREQGLDF